MQVMIGGSGTWRGGEELRETLDLVGEGTWDNEGGAWGWDGLDRSFDDGRGKVLNRDVGKGDAVNWIFELSWQPIRFSASSHVHSQSRA